MNTLRTPNMPPIELIRALQQRADQISMLPEVAMEALSLAKSPDCTIVEFINVVQRDGKLATDILSLANSAIFSIGAPASGLYQAVVRLGFKRCRNLILTSSAASLMKKMPLEQEWIRGQLWRHAVTAAAFSSRLNQEFRLGFEGEEFTSALLHDFGKLLFAVARSAEFQEVDSMEFENELGVMEREREVFGVDHAQFGAWFAGHNELPESLQSSIELHHSPEVEHRFQKLTALTAAADQLANDVHRFGNVLNHNPELNTGFQVLIKRQEISEEALQSPMLSELAKQVESDLEQMSLDNN